MRQELKTKISYNGEKLLETTKRKHEILLDVGPRKLVYPLDVTFISDLNPKFVKRWQEAGWDIENTIMLELKHLTIPANEPPQKGSPSGLFSGLVYVWTEQTFFKFIASTKGFFDEHSNIVLKINAWHEKQHVINAAECVSKGVKILTEEDVVKSEVNYVLKTFGKEGFEARRNDVFSSIEKHRTSNAIPGFLALIWLREHFEKNYQMYAKKAFPIPATNYAETLHHRYYQDAMNAIKIYEMFDENPTDLFKHTVKDHSS